MQLTDDQKQHVKQWVKEGCGLSEIQKRLRNEFHLALTFMDVRFLVLDLGIELKDNATLKTMPAIELDQASAKPAATAETEVLNDKAPPGNGNVSVEIDRVMKPNALISGTVTFSDGVSGSWSLDQFGRLGLNTTRQGYRPSQEDLQSFQQELTHLIQSRGM